MSLTGVREFRNVQAPLTLPGMLSTAGHCDQSRIALFLPSFHHSLLPSFFPRFGGDSSVLIKTLPRRLSGVDVEAEYCAYFYRLVAAEYRAEFPVA
jgi:hypothetical protein